LLPSSNLVALRWRTIVAAFGLVAVTLLVRHHLLGSWPALAEIIDVTTVIILGLLGRVLVRALRERHGERRGPDRRHGERRDDE